MPQFLIDKLKREYGAQNKGAIYGTLNNLGAMHGNKETEKGREMQRKHDRDQKRKKQHHRGITDVLAAGRD